MGVKMVQETRRTLNPEPEPEGTLWNNGWPLCSTSLPRPGKDVSTNIEEISSIAGLFSFTDQKSAEGIQGQKRTLVDHGQVREHARSQHHEHIPKPEPKNNIENVTLMVVIVNLTAGFLRLQTI